MNLVRVFRFIDRYLLVIVQFILYLFKFLYQLKKSTKKKVLVIRLWSLGDSVNVLNMCNTLKKKGYTVDVLCTGESSFVFNKQKAIRKIQLFNYKNPFLIFPLISKIRKERYEYVLDTEQFMNMSAIITLLSGVKKTIGFNHMLRSRVYTNRVEYVEMEHFQENFARLTEPLGIKEVPKKLTPLSYSPKAKKRINEILKKYKGMRIIGIHMGTGETALGRRWPTKKFCELANKLTNNKTLIVFTGIPNEIELYNEIKSKLKLKNQEVFIGETSLHEFIYFISKCDLFICNDSGPMHLAAAMGTKVISLFGMNHPSKVGAWPLDKNNNIYKNPKNLPIINNKYSKYPKNNQTTINLINVEDVLKYIK